MKNGKPSLESETTSGITSTRLWAIMRRFFGAAADVIQAEHSVLAEKLRRASPHWMRHTHATHALARGAELTTVRDNLRHASIATTSIYLHGDEVKRARQLPVAIPIGLFTAWKFQKALIGRSYKPRSGPERTFGFQDSWMAGLAGAALLVFLQSSPLPT